MAISLKNHEDRIVELEKYRYSIKKLTPEPVKLTRTWKRVCNASGYKFIFVIFTGGYEIINNKMSADLSTDASGLISLDVIFDNQLMENRKVIRTPELERLSEWSEIAINPDMTIDGWSTQSGTNPNDNYVMIWGLNLYYKLRAFVSEVMLCLSR